MLRASDISTARLECLVMLEDATGKDRAWLLAHPEFEISIPKVKKLNYQIKRRAKHEPFAYIRGKSEFYGREYIVSADTLQPRPESETMITLLADLVESSKLNVESKNGDRKHDKGNDIKKRRLTVIDVGTGSGCLAITTKLELPQLKVIATEISKSALTIARQNAKKNAADIIFCQGNLLDPVPTSYFLHSTIVIANLPYVPDNHTINQAAMYEPKLAIFGGPDGLDIYRQLFHQIATRLLAVQFKGVRYVITESLPPQHKVITKIAQNAGFSLRQVEDFIQVFESI